MIECIRNIIDNCVCAQAFGASLQKFKHMKGKTDVKEFFGIGGYTREPEGFLSWQHITFVLILMTTMVALAVWLGLSNRDKTDKQKNKALIWSAILINTVEIIKLVAFCINAKNPFEWIYHLPLFLCSIQLITIPLAAFTKGRIREASLDFVMIFGIVLTGVVTVAAEENAQRSENRQLGIRNPRRGNFRRYCRRHDRAHR